MWTSPLMHRRIVDFPDFQPWGMAIALLNANTPYEKFLQETATSWHKDGTLIALERKWGLPPSEWLGKMRAEAK